MKDKIQAIVDRYAEALAEKGVKITLKKRYVEDDVVVRPYSPSVGSFVLNELEKRHDIKKESEKGYNYERNKYYTLVLTVSPIERSLVKKEECRDYSFVVKKVERPHVGIEPHKVDYKEEKIVKKIEKRIQKILRRAEKHPPQKICKDTVCDAFRYTMHPRYKYKNRILGKEYFFWDMLFVVLAGVSVIAVVLLAWLISVLI